MNININDYLSEEEKKQIAEDVYRKKIASTIKAENDLKRFLSNVAYEIFYNVADELFDNNAKEALKAEIAEVCGDITSFKVFKEPNAWDKEPNSAYKYLQECINDNKHLIRESVIEKIPTETTELLKEDLRDLISEAVDARLFGEK